MITRWRMAGIWRKVWEPAGADWVIKTVQDLIMAPQGCLVRGPVWAYLWYIIQPYSYQIIALCKEHILSPYILPLYWYWPKPTIPRSTLQIITLCKDQIKLLTHITPIPSYFYKKKIERPLLLPYSDNIVVDSTKVLHLYSPYKWIQYIKIQWFTGDVFSPLLFLCSTQPRLLLRLFTAKSHLYRICCPDICGSSLFQHFTPTSPRDPERRNKKFPGCPVPTGA